MAKRIKRKETEEGTRRESVRTSGIKKKAGRAHISIHERVAWSDHARLRISSSSLVSAVHLPSPRTLDSPWPRPFNCLRPTPPAARCSPPPATLRLPSSSRRRAPHRSASSSSSPRVLVARLRFPWSLYAPLRGSAPVVPRLGARFYATAFNCTLQKCVSSFFLCAKSGRTLDF